MNKYCFYRLRTWQVTGPSHIRFSQVLYPNLIRYKNGQRTNNKRTTNGQEQELIPFCHLLMPKLAGAKVHVFWEPWLG